MENNAHSVFTNCSILGKERSCLRDIGTTETILGTTLTKRNYILGGYTVRIHFIVFVKT